MGGFVSGLFFGILLTLGGLGVGGWLLVRRHREAVASALRAASLALQDRPKPWPPVPHPDGRAPQGRLLDD
jgi:hypothetical protein